jgi:hypothetical protein
VCFARDHVDQGQQNSVQDGRIKENKYSGNRESHRRHCAGTVHSNKIILILCEGLTTMSGVLGGLSDDDKNV